ncbi:MAG: DUF1501 domain-containing protein [Planctomycetota bacterium]
MTRRGLPSVSLSRRELLRVGGAGLIGLSLPSLLKAEALASRDGGPGWNRAKSIILLYLQGGPSHIDLWDPKDGVPDDVRSPFRTMKSKVPGMEVTELLPRLAQITDRITMIRSMAYTPNGLFNHTAAIYQMLTGYTADRVSPSGQLEPPSPKDFPNFGANIVRLRPPQVPMLPFVMMPRPLQESNVVGKAGTAGFLGRAFDPYTLYPNGDDLDQQKMDRIRIQDLRLRPELSIDRLERRGRLRDRVGQHIAEIDRAVERFQLDHYTEQAMGLVLSGRARDAFDLSQEPDAVRESYGKTTFGDCCLLARRCIEAGARVVQVNWPKVANSDRHSWDMHKGLKDRLSKEAAPMFDAAYSSLIQDLDQRGMLEDTLVVAVGEFGRSPKRGISTSGNDNSDDGRDHWPYCFTALAAGAGIRRGFVYGKSDETGSAPLEDPVHPTELLATIYHAAGIPADTLVYNHLNQPREITPGSPVLGLFS